MTSTPAAAASRSWSVNPQLLGRGDPTLVPGGPAIATHLDTGQIGTDVQNRLQHGLDLLTALIPGCQHASVTTRQMCGLKVQAATDDTSRRADDLQQQLREGPVLQAMRTDHSIIAHDLRTDTRWPRWTVRALDELRVGSVLSIMLLTSRWRIATLNLYSTSPGGFVNVDLALLHLLALPLASALIETSVASIEDQ